MCKWIPVSERLPKEGERCLIYPVDGDAETAIFEHGEWMAWDFLIDIDTVTHWQPLPELPQNKRPSENFKLPDFLTKQQQNDVAKAIKSGTPIIISGKQGPTGKTTLTRILRENGITAYEEWECTKIVLNNSSKDVQI